MKLFAPDRAPQWLFLAVTTAVGVWAGGRWIDPIGDTGFAWSLAYRLGSGEVLYRDIYVVYGPLSPYLLAAVGRIFGLSSLSYLLMNWVPAILAGWLLLECARRHLSVLEGVALVTLMLGLSLFVPGPGRLVYPYYPGVVHALVFSLAALLLTQAPPERLLARAFAAGALAGLALCCKPELGFAALAALIAASAAGVPRPLAWLARVIAGFGSIAAAAFLFAISCDTLASLRANSHLWPLAPAPPPELTRLNRLAAGMAESDWPLSVRSAAFQLLLSAGLLGLVALLAARERNGRRFLPLGGLFGLLAVWLALDGRNAFRGASYVCLSAAAGLAIAALAFFRPRTEGRTFLVAFGVFATLAGARTAFSSTTTGAFDGPAHFAGALAWVLLLCVFASVLLTGGGAAALWARRIFACAILWAAAPYAWNGAEALRFPWRLAVETRQGTVFLDPPQARQFGVLAHELKAGERALVLPEVSAVDVLYGVRQASPFLNHLPGWYDATAEGRDIERLEKSPPDVVVLFDRPIPEYGVEPFGRGFGRELAAWIERRYRPVSSLPTGTIMRPAANRSPPATGP